MFEDWVAFALHHNSSIIDDYDYIDEDMAPFRAMGPQELSRRVAMYASGNGKSNMVQSRGGRLINKGHQDRHAFLESLVRGLPDFDLPINGKDEPSVVARERDEFSRPDRLALEYVSRSPYAWDVLSRPCHYTSYSSRMAARNRIRGHQNGWLEDEMDICKHPEHHYRHGNLHSPNMFELSQTLIPTISISKLSTTSDMRAPPYLYYWKQWRSAEKKDYTTFSEKQAKLYWRGTPTGMYPTVDNWRTGHRQRFVLRAKSLLNDTEKAIYGSEVIPSNQVDVEMSSYAWCNEGAEEACRIQKSVMGASGHDQSSGSFNFQYVFDLDGNGSSGRFYRLLDSNSAVLKQTLYYEWHDERLIPWLHYIPISMSMKELPAVLNFFTSTPQGQEIGQSIATAGTVWAQQTLRNIDMTIYWYRFLIEYVALFR